ncbi:MAG: NAD(P)/FAD-dependent oxidoreductase [Elainellaceae cyanobacterium]
MTTIGIIGGGAAGFFGAIACAEAFPETRVELFEAGHKPLTKVLISGGGRCNVTHSCFDPAQLVQHYPRGGRSLRGAFSRFQPSDTVRWFQQRGIALKTEADGRMFPVTDDSATIAHGLMKALTVAGGVLHTEGRVTAVRRVESGAKSGFEIHLKHRAPWRCDRLLLATGSHPTGYALAQTLGHTLVPPVPSLFTFTVPDATLRLLAGVAVEAAEVQLLPPSQPLKNALKQTGPVLITHWGFSGPAVLKLSAWGARALHDCGYRATLRINWCPGLSADHVRGQLMQMKESSPKRAIASTPLLGLPRRLWRYLIERAGIQVSDEGGDRWAHLSKQQLHRLVLELTQAEWAIAGKGVFKDEFVTCGGVSLKEVNFKTMESRLCPGLYFAGEILDIDGVTGGFNFQNAWTTGWIAGQSMGV